MLDVAVIEDVAAAGATLDPLRARLLAALAEPGSATSADRAAFAEELAAAVTGADLHLTPRRDQRRNRW
jgi:hypothetical protein